MVGETALILALVFTVAHVLCDLRNFAVHVRHARDWFSLLGVVALLGHVLFTGELVRWIGALNG
jgi:uncharacterized membrane protein YgdD (TMEM256/DUF423 family)